MSKSQRRYLADKLGDLANLAMAALIFGQVVSGKEINKPWLVLGFILVICFYILGVTLVKTGGAAYG